MDTETLDGIAKIIIDLTELLGALRTATVPGKPWQRQLLRDLGKADAQLQVLRMTIAMNRHDGEIRAAAQSLDATLAASATDVSRGRADQEARAAMRLLAALARELKTRLLARSSYAD